MIRGLRRRLQNGLKSFWNGLVWLSSTICHLWELFGNGIRRSPLAINIQKETGTWIAVSMGTAGINLLCGFVVLLGSRKHLSDATQLPRDRWLDMYTASAVLAGVATLLIISARVAPPRKSYRNLETVHILLTHFIVLLLIASWVLFAVGTGLWITYAGHSGIMKLAVSLSCLSGLLLILLIALRVRRPRPGPMDILPPQE